MTVLAGVRLPDGELADVTLDPVAGTIAAITTVTASVTPAAQPGDGDRLDLSGYLLLPAPAEPHAHLDKALLGQRVVNASGDLAGAITAMMAAVPSITHADLVARGRQAALTALAHGATALRTHADVGVATGLRHVEALIAVRDSLRDVMTIQVVALTATPTAGEAGRANADLLRAALAMGADVAGGCPHLDPDPLGCLDVCLAAARAAGVPLDLHTDENTDPRSSGLADLAAAVSSSGFASGVTAGHCVSLGVQPTATVAVTAAAVAAAGIVVVALPQTNLFLQGRDQPVATVRGLTAVRALLDAGAVVAAGGDNVQDPFNTMGRGDPLEAASLLVVAGHVLPHEAYTAISAGARAAMGLPTVTLTPGSPAELLAIRAGSLTEAVATAHPDRWVFSRGRVVAVSQLNREFPAGVGT